MRRGLIFLSLIVLAMLSLASAYTAIAKQSSYPIEIKYIKGTQIWVPQYSKVDVYVTLQNPGSTKISGTLKVEVRRDFAWAFDDTYTTLYEDITLEPHETKEFQVGSFYANDLTGKGNFRQYFVRVYFNDQLIHNPQDPDTREWVKTYKR